MGQERELEDCKSDETRRHRGNRSWRISKIAVNVIQSASLFLMDAVEKAYAFDAILVAQFDRFARSTKHLVLALEEFQALGIDFISLSESIDTSTPMGRMVFTVIGAVAEQERSLIRERVVMGLSRLEKAATAGPTQSLGRCRGRRRITGARAFLARSRPG